MCLTSIYIRNLQVSDMLERLFRALDRLAMAHGVYKVTSIYI